VLSIVGRNLLVERRGGDCNLGGGGNGKGKGGGMDRSLRIANVRQKGTRGD
jgi:hypothetical protein